LDAAITTKPAPVSCENASVGNAKMPMPVKNIAEIKDKAERIHSPGVEWALTWVVRLKKAN
jgi:hypothetical protein